MSIHDKLIERRPCTVVGRWSVVGLAVRRWRQREFLQVLDVDDQLLLLLLATMCRLLLVQRASAAAQA